ncbi:MAG: MFS transporter [Vibrio sp.]
MNSNERVFKPYNYLCYGLADVIGSGAFTLISAWLLFFLTTFCGLSPIEAGSLFAIARIMDVILSPTIGYISDNFHKTKLGRRFGRRRFFLIICVPFVFVYSLLWTQGLSYLTYLLAYIAFEIVYMMILIPYDTLAAEMTSDFSKRSKLTSARMYVAQIASFASAFIPGRLIDYFGQESASSFFYAGLIFSASFAIVLFFVYFGTWERSVEEIEAYEKELPPKEKTSIAKQAYYIYYDFVSTLKIKAFRSELGMYLGGSVGQDVFNAVFTYFVVFGLVTSSAIAANALTIVTGFQFFGVTVATWLTLRNSPTKAYIIQGCMALLAFVMFGLSYYSSQWSMFILYSAAVVAGLARGGMYSIPWNTYTFVADIDEVLTRQRREGIFAGFMSLLRKTCQAMSMFLVGAALEYSGFMSGVKTQPQSAIDTIMIIMVILPFALTLWGIYAATQFKVDGKTHAVLCNEVARLKQGGKLEETAPEVQATIEAMTGLPWKKSWGNNDIGHINKVHNSTPKPQARTEAPI